jgi:hypothetical protein
MVMHHLALRPCCRLAVALVFMAMLAGCQSRQAGPRPLAQRIEEAHGIGAWEHRRALVGDMHIQIDDRPALDMRFIYDINTGRTRMQLADDTILVWDGQQAWVSPPSSQTRQARHTLRVWPHLVVLPFMLHQAGTTIDDERDRALGGEQVPSFRLTPGRGPLDAPSAYIIYADPQTNLIRGVACISPDGREPGQIDQNIRAVTYYKYRHIEGARIAQEWRLWDWNPQVGLVGMPIGWARIYNLDFGNPKPNAFVKPANARQDNLP